MEKNNKPENKLDKIFKDRFDDFLVPPPANANHEDRLDKDRDLQSKLNQFEATPDTENWNQIKRQIPLSLQMKRQLNWWSKVAAFLVVGMIGSLIASNYFTAVPTVVESKQDDDAEQTIVHEDWVWDLDDQANDKSGEENVARILFDPPEKIVEVNRDHIMEALDPIESKQIESLAETNNDGLTLKREGNLDEMPMPIQRPVEGETLVSKGKMKKDTASQNNN